MLISTDGVKTLINLYVNGVFAPGQCSREKRMNKKYGAGTPQLRSYREREKTFTYKHIDLTVKKLFKIAISTMSRMAGLAVCKSRIYNFILPAKKYENKRPNKQG